MAWRVDDRFSPIILLLTQGTVSDEDLHAYVGEIDVLTRRLIADNTKRVAIVVADERTINSTERARMAKAHERLSSDQTSRLISFMVSDSALMRGALTALSWLMPGKLGMVHAVSTYDKALSEAVKMLEKLGLEAPKNLAELTKELTRLTERRERTA